MFIIYFSCNRYMKMTVNFRNQISCYVVTKFIVTTHFSRYKVISSIAFSNVLTISVAFILPANPIAVFSLILFVYITVPTALVVIIPSISVLNWYYGYTNLIHHIINFWKILSKSGLSHAHHHILKHQVNCYQEAGIIISYLILICYSSFFPRCLF